MLRFVLFIPSSATLRHFGRPAFDHAPPRRWSIRAVRRTEKANVTSVADCSRKCEWPRLNFRMLYNTGVSTSAHDVLNLRDAKACTPVAFYSSVSQSVSSALYFSKISGFFTLVQSPTKAKIFQFSVLNLLDNW